MPDEKESELEKTCRENPVWAENLKFYHSHLGEFEQKYGKDVFLAIHDGQVLDTDKNDAALVGRVVKKYGEIGIYFGWSDGIRTVHMRSPKFVKISPELEKMLGEGRQFFEANIKELEEKYGRNTYVALCKGKIVDSDKDETKLAERVEQNFPNDYSIITSAQFYQCGVSESEPIANCMIIHPKAEGK